MSAAINALVEQNRYLKRRLEDVSIQHMNVCIELHLLKVMLGYPEDRDNKTTPEGDK